MGIPNLVHALVLLINGLLGKYSHSNPIVLFQFGDSLSDTGNALLGLGETGAASPPYGMTYFGHPTGRVCDGRLIIDFIAIGIGIPLLTPYFNKGANTAHGVNFATNGATALGYSFYKERNMSNGLVNTLPLDMQLDMFMEYQNLQYKGSIPSTAIYMVSEIGGNDYKTMIQNKLNSSQMHSLVPIVIGAIQRHIVELYKAGAKKFVVVNIPLEGCNPLWRAVASPSDELDKFGCLIWINDVNRHHNSLLLSMVRRLKHELAGISVSYGDMAGVLTNVLENPSAHGILNPLVPCCGIYTKEKRVSCNSKACCGHPWNALYWNDNHFTEHFYGIVAQHFMSRTSTFMYPPIDW